MNVEMKTNKAKVQNVSLSIKAEDLFLEIEFQIICFLFQLKVVFIIYISLGTIVIISYAIRSSD